MNLARRRFAQLVTRAEAALCDPQSDDSSEFAPRKQ